MLPWNLKVCMTCIFVTTLYTVRSVAVPQGVANYSLKISGLDNLFFYLVGTQRNKVLVIIFKLFYTFL